MKRHPTPFAEVVLFELDAHQDDRGELIELWRTDAGLPAFAQTNLTRSRAGVLRGLHYQLTRPQGKLVSVVRGDIYDVVVDIRRTSPTFGRWFGARLSAKNYLQMWCPPGFAHGFVALDEADVVYQLTAAYDPDDQRAVRWNDPTLAIAWPVERPLTSARDASAASLTAAELPP